MIDPSEGYLSIEADDDAIAAAVWDGLAHTNLDVDGCLECECCAFAARLDGETYVVTCTSCGSLLRFDRTKLDERAARIRASRCST